MELCVLVAGLLEDVFEDVLQESIQKLDNELAKLILLASDGTYCVLFA